MFHAIFFTIYIRWFHSILCLVDHIRTANNDRVSAEISDNTTFIHGFGDETIFSPSMGDATRDQYAQFQETEYNQSDDAPAESEVEMKSSIIEMIEQSGNLSSIIHSSRFRDASELPSLHSVYPVAEHVVPHSLPTILRAHNNGQSSERRQVNSAHNEPPVIQSNIQIRKPRTSLTTTNAEYNDQSNRADSPDPLNESDQEEVEMTPTSDPLELDENVLIDNDNATSQSRRNSGTPLTSNFHLPKVTVHLTKLNLPSSNTSARSDISDGISTRSRSRNQGRVSVNRDTPPLVERTRSSTSTPQSATSGRSTNDNVVSSSRLKRSTDQGQSETNSIIDLDASACESPARAANSADDDQHFLVSLLPYIHVMNAQQKLKIRMKIQKAIFRELYREDGNSSKRKKK